MNFKTWNIKKILKESVIMLVIVLVVSNALSYIRKPDFSSSQLPQLNETLINGAIIESKTFEGKPLLLHFWATWCPVCKAEADNIQRLSKYYNVVTIAVKSGSDREIDETLKKRHFNYNVINDSEGKWAKMYNIEAYPTTFIYDRSGEIAFSEVGYSSTLGLALRMWWAGI